MVNSRQKLWVGVGFAVLLSAAFGAGCRGFFVNPTLTSITVSPQSPTISQNTTLQLSATGTYDDGSIKTLTSNVFWTSSDPSSVSITSGGLIKGIAQGTSTVTASSGIATGTTTVTVTIANLVSIQISPTAPSIKQGNTQTFTVSGTVAGGGSPVDVTSTATWTVTPSNAGVNILNQGSSPVSAQAAGPFNSLPATYTITATVPTGTTNLTSSATLTVTP
ncbi:MAG TPA: Ig-like domain-containing protein [Terriglobales bacterium]|nr:Ig-like domain-containing protein [Terriglobales bacterium]